MDFNYGATSNVATHRLYRTVSKSDGTPFTPGETVRIDVKTRSRRKTKSKKRQVGHEIYRSPTKIQKAMDVVLMIVDSDSWKVHPTRSKLTRWLKRNPQ